MENALQLTTWMYEVTSLHSLGDVTAQNESC